MKYLGWCTTAVGAAVAVVAVVLGLAAPTAEATWGWVLVEAAGCVLIALGLHTVHDR